MGRPSQGKDGLRRILTVPLVSIRGTDHMTGKLPRTKQIYFFLMPEETLAVIRFILAEGCRIYLPRSSSLVPAPCLCESLNGLSQLYFCPQELSGGIRMNKASEHVYFLDPTISPVIEFQCSVMRGSELSRGRMYFRGGYAGRYGWVGFPEKLYKIFGAVSNHLKKNILTRNKEYDGFISKGCRAYISGGGGLVQF
jgi:hypothetical protein